MVYLSLARRYKLTAANIADYIVTVYRGSVFLVIPHQVCRKMTWPTEIQSVSLVV